MRGLRGPIAQLGERRVRNAEVVSSILIRSTKNSKMLVRALLSSVFNLQYPVEGFPSGQRDQTVNLTALPSKVRILPPPPSEQHVKKPLPEQGLFYWHRPDSSVVVRLSISPRLPDFDLRCALLQCRARGRVRAACEVYVMVAALSGVYH